MRLLFSCRNLFFSEYRSKPVAKVIQKGYGQKTVKKVRKLEKIDYQLGKTQIDQEFLINRSSISVVPKFLNFRVASKSSKSSRTYQQCQLSLLHLEVRQKNLIYETAA